MREYLNRLPGTASPATLGAIRILVCGILLANVLWEDLASAALFPRELLRPMGVLTLLWAWIPDMKVFVSSASALMVFKVWVVFILTAGIVGYRTRFVLPLAAFSYLVFAGILRMNAWFYHTGLVPLYLLIFLCFLPCADGLSLDRRRRTQAGKPVPELHEPQSVYAWSRYALWVTLAVPYFGAGISKLRLGEFAWLSADNMRGIVVRDSVNPMEFDFGVGEAIAGAPDFVFSFLAFSAVASEVFYGLVLFSVLARRVLPLFAVGLHVGIWLMQNVLFFDLILLQLIFMQAGTFKKVVERFTGLPHPRAISGALHYAIESVRPLKDDTNARQWPPPLGALLVIVAVIGISTFAWIGRIEYYPLTSWKMYTGLTTEPEIRYFKVVGRRADGAIVRVDFDDGIGALADSRYRRMLTLPFRKNSRPSYFRFVEITAREINKKAQAGEALTDIEIQDWSWRFDHAPDGGFRKINRRHVYQVGSRNSAPITPLPVSQEELAYEYEAGISNQKIGDFAGALIYFNRVYASAPNYRRTSFHRERSLQRLGRRE